MEYIHRQEAHEHQDHQTTIIAYAGGESSFNHPEWLKESTLSSESLTLMEYIEQYLVSLGSR